MEYLDTYDENKNFLGKQSREYVHANAIWHNTVHGWLYDGAGNLYFQIRADEKTFYTTASGHVLAGETVEQALNREIEEEIGLDIDEKHSILVDIVPFKMDNVKKDGSIFKDRAFAHVYVLEFKGKIDQFHFDISEVEGVVKVNANDAITLFQQKIDAIPAEMIINKDGVNTTFQKNIRLEEFLVNKGETAFDKYGFILNKVIELTSDKSEPSISS